VTGCTKTGLITHDCRFDFSSQTWTHYQISQSKSPKFEWSAFAGCFSQANWQLYKQSGTLWRLGQSRVSCVWLYSFAVLNNDLYFEFVFILVSFEPEWLITWSGLTISLPDNFFSLNPCPPTTPTTTHCSVCLIQPTSVKKLFKMAGNLIVDYLVSG